MKRKFYNPRHKDLYTALFALSLLGVIIGIGYGLMEYEREYIDPCSIEPIVDTDAMIFFEEHKDIPTETLEEMFSEAKEYAVRLTGKVREIDEEGEYIHLQGSPSEPHNFINCSLRETLDPSIYSPGDEIKVQCYCKGKKVIDSEDPDDTVASMIDVSSTEILLYKCCVK